MIANNKKLGMCCQVPTLSECGWRVKQHQLGLSDYMLRQQTMAFFDDHYPT